MSNPALVGATAALRGPLDMSRAIAACGDPLRNLFL
jgi:hypothetical protein